MKKIFLRFGKYGLGAMCIAVAGLVVADHFLPPNLARYEERSTVVLDAEGGILRAFTTSDGMWRLASTVGEVDTNYIDALIAYEDQRFYDHPGVDGFAVVRAAGQWISNGRIISGASTLTMQAARLLEPRPRNLSSKMVEMLRAMQLEWHYSKDEILDIYLTLAPFGGNLEGVRAASLAYFGKEPAELTVAQAALLVALPQSPERLRPDRHPQAAAVARANVLDHLAMRGALEAARAQEALEDPIPLARATLPFHAPRLARHLRQRSGENDRIQTFIDPLLQEFIEQFSAAEGAMMQDDGDMAVIVVENATSRVIAYSGGVDFWGPEGQVDLVRASRSPGSTLKPFIYGMAFEDLALHPETLLVDRAQVFGAYAPRNFDRAFLGDVTVRGALHQSLNVPAVMVLEEVGPMRLASRLRQTGARLDFGNLAAAPSLPLALGGVGLSLGDLTMLYTGLANGGDVRALMFSDAQTPTEPRHLMDEAAAWYLTDILAGSPLPDGRAQGQGTIRAHNIAFKTGTSYGYRDAWAVGYSGDYTVGIWVGRADGSPRPGYYGRNTAAPILFDIFDQLPASTDAAAPPAEALIVTHRDQLPRPMQRFIPSSDEVIVAAEEAPPPRIAFPPSGAVLDYGDETQVLALRAVGGEPPLRWMVDGAILPRAPDFTATLWQPTGAGFTEITVVDASGRADRAQIRFVEDPEN